MSLDFSCSYLTKRKKGTKINLSYSKFEEIISGEPQGSISTHTYAIFIETEDLHSSSYADYKTPFTCLLNLVKFYQNLKLKYIKCSSSFKIIITNRARKKCHLLTNSKSEVDIKIPEKLIKSENSKF